MLRCVASKLFMRTCLRSFPLWRSAALLILLTLMSTSASPISSQYLLYVGVYGKGIHAFRYHPDSTQFESLGLVGEFPNPSDITTDAAGRFLYAVSEADKGNGAVGSFKIDRASGKLTALNQHSSEGVAPCHLAVDRSTKLIAAANYGTGSVPVFPIEADGSLGKLSTLLTAQGSSADPKRQEGPHAHEIVISADNRFLYVPDLGLDKIRIYRINAAAHQVVPNDPPFVQEQPGTGPRHMVFSHDAHFAYVIHELTSAVTAYKVNATNGNLEAFQSLPATADGKPFDGAAEILLHPSGHTLYTSVRGPGTIAVFSVDSQTGKLQGTQTVETGGTWPRGVAVDPTGKLLLAGDQKTNQVALFHIDPTSGKLTPTGQKLEVPSPVAFAFVKAE